MLACSFNNHMKAKLEICRLDLRRDLRSIEIAQHAVVRSLKARTRAVQSFHRSLHTHSGHLRRQVDALGDPMSDDASTDVRHQRTTEKRTGDGRKSWAPKLYNPKMEFGFCDFQLGMTSRASRRDYCRHFDVDFVIRRHLARKSLVWPSTPPFAM